MEQTELQQSIFNAPPPGVAPEVASGVTTAPASGLPHKATAPVDQVMRDGTPDSRGQKRTRDDDDGSEDESDEDVAMEEDSDDE